jgi:hypothetical protein
MQYQFVEQRQASPTPRIEERKYMDAVTTQASEVDHLVSLVDSENPFDMPHAEVLPRQLEAINERFQDRVGRIKLLKNRAEEGGIAEVRSMADVVPLLFAHTAYKSYPESWLMEGKWDRLGKWLDTVSTYRVEPMDTSQVKGLDEWIALLGECGHHVSCSSGTTGKCAMMNASDFDLGFAGHALLQGLIWSGIAPNRDRMMISSGQVASTPRNAATGRPMFEALALPDVPPFRPDVPPITIGGITEMVVLRKKIADGTARPSELEYYEEQAAAREKAMESAIDQAVEAYIANRHRKLHVTGMFPALYATAERIRARGYSGKDFHPENTAYFAGGLKRAQVPADFLDTIFETFNLSWERVCHGYGMQEINTCAIKCSHGRYHMAPWVMLLLLDESGENLIEPELEGEVEGRAAFFDLALDGRWGGIISGDKIRATWAPCACGNRSPSIADDIQRYADQASGDKIACAGTIDAYVRGVT